MLPSDLCIDLPGDIFPSGILIKILYAFLNFPMQATSPVHLTLLVLTTLLISGEKFEF
jgi:hypothetical protein